MRIISFPQMEKAGSVRSPCISALRFRGRAAAPAQVIPCGPRNDNQHRCAENNRMSLEGQDRTDNGPYGVSRLERELRLSEIEREL
jgi:hypothetical protein